jgi:hypothetical protein
VFQLCDLVAFSLNNSVELSLLCDVLCVVCVGVCLVQQNVGERRKNAS